MINYWKNVNFCDQLLALKSTKIKTIILQVIIYRGLHAKRVYQTILPNWDFWRNGIIFMYFTSGQNGVSFKSKGTDQQVNSY